MNELKGFEPVAEVMWYEPLLHDEKGCGRKIIDASMEFMDAVPLGTKLYTANQLAQVVQQRDELQAKWDHYQQFCQDHGAHGIGDLVVQRDELLAAAKVALEAMESTGMFPASQYKLQAAITKVQP